jgi:hypothetical protein
VFEVWATAAPAQVGELTLTYFDDSAPEIVSVVPRSVLLLPTLNPEGMY